MSNSSQNAAVGSNDASHGHRTEFRQPVKRIRDCVRGNQGIQARSIGFGKQSRCLDFCLPSHRDSEQVHPIRNEIERREHNPLLFFLKWLDTDDARLPELICDEIKAREWFIHCDSPDSRNSGWFARPSRRIASGANDDTVRIWGAQNGEELICLRGHEDSVKSVAFSPNGRWIASGAKDRAIRLWDARSGVELLCLRGHEGIIRSVAFSPDGRRIASGAWDHTIRIWDAQGGQELFCLDSPETNIWCLAFSPDGQRSPARRGT